MAFNASTPILAGNPLAFSSGWLNPPNAQLQGEYKIQRLYWFQPDLTSSSSVYIYDPVTGVQYALLKCEVSGQSQQLNLGDQWWNKPYVSCVPSGTLYIYLDD